MKTRVVQTRFWNDSFIRPLSIEAKLLFSYVITNQYIELTGAYECPDDLICSDTGLRFANLNKIKSELKPKVSFIQGWVIVKNATKYNNYAKGSPKQRDAYEREFNRLPEFVKNELVGNQLGTSWELDRIQNTEYRNKNTEIQEITRGEDIIEIQGMEFEDAINHPQDFVYRRHHPTKSNEFTPEFLAWWEIYPKKISKRDANRIWDRIIVSAELVAKVMEHTRFMRDSKQWTKNDGEFIPNPTTYLNGHRWEDEVKSEKRGYTASDVRI